MKIIFKIHPLYYVVALITIFTGLFKDFIYVTLLIFIHEIGHISGAIYYKWKIKKVVILPFGGITIFNELINKSLKEEFVILILGPIFQILFYFILCLLNIESNLITSYHYSLLIFNFIPIIPLDGSKLLNILLNKLFSFKLSHILTIIISLISFTYLFIRTIILKNLILFIIIFFLLLKIIKELKLHRYIFNKFLFERYNYNLNFKKTKKIKGLKLFKMKKDYKHLFYLNTYITEKDVLKKYFKI
jgi:stage IV sporulation protein FB